MNDQNKKDTYVQNEIKKKEEIELYDQTFPPLTAPELTPHSKFNKSYFRNKWSNTNKSELIYTVG